VLNYDWNFSRIAVYGQAFLQGMELTIYLSVATILFSTVVGLLWGTWIARSRLAYIVSLPVIDVLRSLPPLVLVLFGYYFFTREVIGVTFSVFVSFTIAVGLNVSAFIADLTRAALTNTTKEFSELGHYLGMDENQSLYYILSPLAFREIIAPLSYLYIETIKLTSLASVVSVKEVVYVAQAVIVETTRSLEVWTIVSVIYLALIIPLTIVVRRVERQVKLASGLNR
jgi:His/Glu/Gln/Arg/opine family amino acid ABC transporter permease subunit